jgi:PAS domain S-box-containing protein
MREPTNLFSTRLFLIAVVFGCTALAVILAGFFSQIPGTNSVTDPGDVLILIGAALTGPIGGFVIGALAGLADPILGLHPYVMASHIVGAMWVGWAYKMLVHDRIRMPLMLLGWLAISFVYYFVCPVPVVLVTRYFLPEYFAQVFPEPRPLFSTLMVLFQRLTVSFALSTAVSSAVLLVLPRRARSPIWWTRNHPRTFSSFRAIPPRQIVALRLTVWVLILSCVPLVTMAIHLRNTLSRIYVQAAAEDKLELIDVVLRTAKSDSEALEILQSNTSLFSDSLSSQFIMDDKGRVVWHRDSTQLYADARGVIGRQPVEEILKRRSGFFYNDQKSLCYLYTRFHDDQRWLVVGLDIGFGVSSLREFEHATLIRLGMALILVAGVAGIVIWLIIGRPIRTLADAARRVGRNDLSARVEPELMSDEVGLFGEAFNEMTENLGILHDGLQTEIEERRATEVALRKSEHRFRELADLLPQPIYEVDLSGRFLFANRAAAEMFRLEPAGPTGTASIFDYIAEGDRDRARSISTELLKGAVPAGIECTFQRGDGSTFHGLIYSSLISEGGQPIGLRSLVVDISEQRRIQRDLQASVAEKELMLKEIHHRVKNNLQIISSLLSLQSSAISDPTDIALFGESVDRIRSMALIHDRLYKSPDLAGIEFREYIESLVTSLFHSYGRRSINFRTDVQDVRLSIDTAIPFGLIINELVTNALKHAFPEGREGEIKVSLTPCDDGGVRLSVADSGIGMPDQIDLEKTTSLGLQLVSILTHQLMGTIEIQRGGGTTFSIIIPQSSTTGPVASERANPKSTGDIPA